MLQSTRYFLLLLILSSPFISESYGQGVKGTFAPSSRFFPGYGNVTVGKTKDQNITITNDPSSPSPISCIVAGPNTGNFSIVGPSTFNVDIGQTYTLTIRFQPTAAGQLHDTIYITHNADTSAALRNPLRYNFSGTGVAPDTFPKIGITPGGSFGSFINFGNVTIGKTTSMTFMIKNVSDTIKTLSGSISNPTRTIYSIASGGGNFSLDTGKTDVVTVNFTPDSAGQIFDSIIVTSNANSANNRIRVFLSGTGVKASPLPKITISGVGFNGIKFGYDTVGHAPRTASFTITNTSDSARKLTGNIAGPGSPFSITSGGGSFSLDSGKSITVQLAFSSPAGGTFKDSVIITSNSDAANQLKTVYLNGTAGAITGPRISVQPAVLDFGTLNLNQQIQPLTATIKNLSDLVQDTLKGTVAMPSLPFAVTSGSGNFSILHNDSLHIVVTMATDKSGTFKDSIVISSNSSDNAKRFVLRLNGFVITVGSVDGKPETRNFIAAMPNPFNAKVAISFSLDLASSVSMKIYDMTGKEVFAASENIYSAGVQQIQGNLTGLNSGAYLCVLHIGKETRSIRIIKD